MPGPLNGIRVVDMTMNVMGPFASQILGDMGADVCKIEPPEGDALRGIGPGSLERPALQRLLAAIRARLIDLVVVFKYVGQDFGHPSLHY